MNSDPYIQEAEVERYAYYGPGGFHPTHLGDTFKDGRYTILNKLGYGEHSVVWLVRDNVERSYAALKILVADALERESSGTELEVLRRLVSGSGPGKRYVLQFRDNFLHEGPNGTHLCFISEISGPSLASHLDIFDDIDNDDVIPPEVARTLIPQIARGVEYIHSCNIVHGDLHLGNILYHSSTINFNSESDIQRYFGEPRTGTIRLVQGKTPLYGPPHVPEHVVYLPDMSPFFEHLFANPSAAEIRICDFSEASILQHPEEGLKRRLNCPRVHTAPEAIFDEWASPAMDIWALGNTMHQILTGGAFYGRTFIGGYPKFSEDDVVNGIVRVLGKLPEPWWSRWGARSKYYDEGAETPQPTSVPFGDGIPTPEYLSVEQKGEFSKVLEGIFRYNSHDRLSAKELVGALAFLEEGFSEPTVSHSPGSV